MVEKYGSVEGGGGTTIKYERGAYMDGTHMDYLNEAMPAGDGLEEPRYCAGCGGQILDRYFLMAAEKHWHVQCLKCYDCKLHLDNELTCFVRDGNTYCKEDYYRRFSIKCCAKCRLGITANEMVMRARELVYHMTCFACCACHKTLLPGDYFGMRDSLVYCREDYENVIQSDQGHILHDMTSAGVMETLMDNIPFYNTAKRTTKGRPRKRKLTAPEGSGFSQGPMGYITGDGDTPPELLGQDGYMAQAQHRQKRVRTSFKHHQLRTMKSYFGLNHNPDAKDLKQLSQKTGLSKRVLQVWFQNARAKFRRHVMKQDGDISGDKTDCPDGECHLSEDEKADDKSYVEMSNNSSSSMSDISSTASLSDIHTGIMDYEHTANGLTDLFSNSINTVN